MARALYLGSGRGLQSASTPQPQGPDTGAPCHPQRPTAGFYRTRGSPAPAPDASPATVDTMPTDSVGTTEEHKEIAPRKAPGGFV